MTECVLGSKERPLRAAIIGSGPSGFYAAEGILKNQDLHAEVDMFEYLPTPYGLVRAGVAPDHQSIKSVVGIYDRIAHLPNIRFWGNVNIGEDISVKELEARFDLIIFATGAQSDRTLCVEGEDLKGCHSATAFVGWYNGHPDFRDYPVDLNCKRATIIGMGNVVDLFGKDPAQAATVWVAIDSVFDGVGGGTEIVGGLWILLVSWAALRGGDLPKALNYLGVVISVAGILSLVPALGELGGMIFGLGQIVWFIWLGIVMLRSNSSTAA